MNLSNSRRQYFLSFISDYASNANQHKPTLFIITHLLPDRPDLLIALESIFNIHTVYAIPYSVTPKVKDWCDRKLHTSYLNLEQMISAEEIKKNVLSCDSQNIILCDIGGYLAPIIEDLKIALGNRLLGLVEGTESGLDAYSKLKKITLPIISLSMSPTKSHESSVIGSGCLFSTERVLRNIGYLNEQKKALIIGYGRIGKSVAKECQKRGMQVSIYDICEDKKLGAISDGFNTPNRNLCLEQANIIFAATGKRSIYSDDLIHIQDNSFLVSCSSKDTEFEFDQLSREFNINATAHNLDTINMGPKKIHVLNKGRPINFLDGANAGPILSLIQCEMIGSLCDLSSKKACHGINPPSKSTIELARSKWYETFFDSNLGWFKNFPPS